ncbi:TPA: LysO family transporter [Salmonella enterica subsp. enterica serovar Eastbourne]
MISSGFGWFSLSGPMVNKLVSTEMGTMAFMTDFFREMFSIIFLYFLGQTLPRSAIGISGAAAFDSALPLSKVFTSLSQLIHVAGTFKLLPFAM